MPTVRFSTEGQLRRRASETARAVTDVAILIGFRSAAVRGWSRVSAGFALVLIVAVTMAAAWMPAYLPGAASVEGTEPFSAHEMLLLLPSAYLGVLLISTFSAASSGGGRELLAREQAVAFPVSPTTDHLGALVMAPLNIAWLLQCWVVLGATAFVVGPANLWAAQAPVVVWLMMATALAQTAAWIVEWLRRGARGLWLVRGLLAGIVAGSAFLIVTDRVVGLLDRSPTVHVVLAALYGSAGMWGPWSVRMGVLLVGTALAVLVGALAAHVLAGRPPREEVRAETAQHTALPNAGSDLVALLRMDRCGIWRSVPLRRGFAVLALLPGLVALGTGMDWYLLNILPGLVASAGALLFGVNAWAVDGRGALWRESLPVRPGLGYLSRVIVLLEVLLLAVALALGLAALGAGAPTAEEATAVVCATLVVTLQVVTGCMRWSLRRPYAVDMRSARATPAPPLTMVGYSTKLAVVTTFTGMVFVATSRFPAWQLSVLVAVPFLLVSMSRLLRSADLWARPQTRSRVVTTVAA